MTRSGRAYALAMPVPAIAATGSSSSRTSPPPTPCPQLLATPMASDSAPERNPHLGGKPPSGAKRQVGLPEVIACHLTALPSDDARAAARERLLPTPDTGTSPNGH